MRVKIIKTYKDYRVDDVVDVSRNVAFGLIDSGVAVIAKDMTARDYKVKKGKRRGHNT